MNRRDFLKLPVAATALSLFPFIAESKVSNFVALERAVFDADKKIIYPLFTSIDIGFDLFPNPGAIIDHYKDSSPSSNGVIPGRGTTYEIYHLGKGWRIKPIKYLGIGYNIHPYNMDYGNNYYDNYFTETPHWSVFDGIRDVFGPPTKRKRENFDKWFPERWNNDDDWRNK